MNAQTDAAIIRASLNDAHVFAEIFSRHVDAVHGYLSRRAGRGTADDLAVHRIFDAVAATRARVWRMGGAPEGWDDPSVPAYVDIDATLVTAPTRWRGRRRPAPTALSATTRTSPSCPTCRCS